ncbi:MAG: glycosyltransferase [Clostridia bacterium]|nr:glycosyltransferase [Clostridia bacterium]
MLSVVVIGRNESATLAGCLRSAREALARVDHELIYVDSGSADGSLPIARENGARCFRLRTAHTTAGLARRTGAREARGESLLFLDGDMLLQPGFVETALTVMETSGYDGATGIRHDLYERGGRVTGEDPNYFRCTARREAPAFGGAILLRAASLERAGGWAANVLTCEEAELHARLAKHGVRVVELPVPMIRHIDRVRDNRGPLGALITPRRLGLGQALVNAIRSRSVWALLKRERAAFLCWITDALCVAALCVGGWPAVWAVAAAQCLQLAAFALLGRGLRGFAGQKLLLIYLPAGVLCYRARDEGYDAWPAATPASAAPAAPRR